MSSNRIVSGFLRYVSLFLLALAPQLGAQVEWQRQGSGPVLTAEMVEGTAVGEPGVVSDGEHYTLWFNVERGGNPGLGILRATSADGILWIPDRELSIPRFEVYAPRVITTDAAYRMWYSFKGTSGCSVGVADSTDGVAWTHLGSNPVLSPAQVWERGCTDAQTVVFDGQLFHMWYTGGTADTASWQRIGHAVSVDGLSWTRSAWNPVLGDGTSQAHDDLVIPCVLFHPETRTFEMWYTRVRAPANIDMQLELATSMDGVAWAPYPDPVMTLGDWDTAIISPAVLFDGALYRMWYKGDYDSKFFSFATSPWSVPRASFNASVLDPDDGEAVTFDASLSVSPGGEITSYRWDFGDGESAEGVTASHAYATPGHREVTLTVVDSAGKQGLVARAIDVNLRAGDLAPWTSSEIGAHEAPAQARLEDAGSDTEQLKLYSHGGDLGPRADALQLVSRETEGDFVLTARLDALEATAPTAKLGLIVREGLDVDARHAAIVLQGASTRHLRFLRRTSPGGLQRSTEGPDLPADVSAWLRLERRGNEVTTFLSEDGLAWQQLGGPVTFDPPLAAVTEAGVAASAGRLGVEGGRLDLLASIGQLVISRGGTGPFLRGDCNGDGGVAGQVTDAVFLLTHQFMGGAAPPCLAACDSNSDGTTDLSDAVYLLSFSFLGGPPPASPYPLCAASEAEGDKTLGCAAPVQGCN